MKAKQVKYLVAFLIFLFAGNLKAQTTRDIPKKESFKIIEKIVGTWKLQRIIDDIESQKEGTRQKNRESEKTETPKTNSLQVIEFDPDGRYTIHSTTAMQDSGSYRINERHNLLYMESDADDITPTQWSVTIQRNILTLEGRDDKQAAKGVKYVYIKTKEGLSTNKE